MMSVRPSVTRRYSVNTAEYVAEYILKIFLPSGRPPFYFFHTKRDGNIPTWNILTGLSNSNARRYETISPIFRFISEMMQVRAIVTTASEYEIVHKL